MGNGLKVFSVLTSLENLFSVLTLNSMELWVDEGLFGKTFKEKKKRGKKGKKKRERKRHKNPIGAFLLDDGIEMTVHRGH